MSVRSGQTLIEAIVAIAIIGIALLGFLSQSTYNYLASNQSLQRNLALNLAREGLEVVRHIRDSNWLIGCLDPDKNDCFYWNSDLAKGTEYRARPLFDTAEDKWILQFLNKSFNDCVSDNSCRLYWNDGLMTAQTSIHPTNFYQQVAVRPICETANECGGDGICDSGEQCLGKQIGLDVQSRVRWQERSEWYNVVLEEKLFNWR